MSPRETKITDAELILACQSDDQLAFRSLVKRYQSTAFRFGFRLTCNTPDTEDLCQQAFIRIWNYRQKIKPDATFSTLLYTIISRLWMDQNRPVKHRLLSRLTETLSSELVDQQSSPETITINQDLAQRIRALSKKLPPRQRLVFTLRDLEDLNINEVVEITGFSIGSVKTNLSLARQKIRKQLRTLTGHQR